MALREILIELGIEVNAGSAQRSVDRFTGGLNRIPASSSAATSSLGRLSTGLGSLRNIAVGLGAVFLTGKIAQGFASMITSAGDAAEVANKFGAVFVEEADRVGASMEDMADRTGQSRIAIKEMAADAGALVKPLVGSNDAAADLAKTMTAAALDISSFENVLPKDALGAIRSAIIGSSEPMLRFGVDTRQAALAQFALDKGLGKSIKSMSTAEVTALRMELIMQRLGDKGAVGDAEKTAGSFTNRLRGLQGAFDDLVAELGTEFLPMATEFLGWLLKFTKDNGPKFIKAMRVVVGVITLFADVIVSLITPLTISTMFC